MFTEERRAILETPKVVEGEEAEDSIKGRGNRMKAFVGGFND